MEKKKIASEDLKLGMYVEELDRPWVDAPFLFQGFEITSSGLLAKVRKVCQHVYVMPDRDRTATYAKLNSGRVSRVEIDAERAVVDGQRGKGIGRVLIQPSTGNCRQHDKTTVEEELEQAREIEQNTRNTVYTILDDVRLGRSISTSEAKKMVANMVESIIRNPDAMVVLTQLKNVDEYTALHSLRVCILALTFGRQLDLNSEELNLLGIGALLHDVGKMKVPLDVLNKPGKLTDAEFEIMKSHVTEGAKIVEQAHGIAPASLEVVRTHHERYAGGGYAGGLAGDDIHPFGLIVAIVDCYDAITSDRVYQKGVSPQDALSRMYAWRTSDFHPTLVEQFIQCMGIYPIGSVVELSDGSIGVVVTVNRERRLLPKVVQVRDRHLKPVAPPRIIDLHYEYERLKKGHVSIRKVLPPGTHGIWPVDHLPLRG